MKDSKVFIVKIKMMVCLINFIGQMIKKFVSEAFKHLLFFSTQGWGRKSNIIVNSHFALSLKKYPWDNPESKEHRINN